MCLATVKVGSEHAEKFQHFQSKFPLRIVYFVTINNDVSGYCGHWSHDERQA